MYQHIIVISSSYRIGKRIAWHYADSEISASVLKELEKKTKEKLTKPDYSIHKLSTESITWKSVVEKDSFFESIEVYKDLDDFLSEIKKNKQVSALDIAKLLLSIQPMSNLKLQKMIYLVYADYLERTKKKLFREDIVAFQYGPVVESIYHYYKEHGREQIELTDELVTLEVKGDEKLINLEEITMPVTIAKILQADDMSDILTSVRKTFEKFGSKSASQLVSITHREGSPWDRTKNFNDVIDDDLILKYHTIELT